MDTSSDFTPIVAGNAPLSVLSVPGNTPLSVLSVPGNRWGHGGGGGSE